MTIEELEAQDAPTRANLEQARAALKNPLFYVGTVTLWGLIGYYFGNKKSKRRKK